MWGGSNINSHHVPPADPPPPPPLPRPPPTRHLGTLQVLRQYEVDVDFAQNRVVMHPEGHAAAGLLRTEGLLPVSCRFTKREQPLGPQCGRCAQPAG